MTPRPVTTILASLLALAVVTVDPAGGVGGGTPPAGNGYGALTGELRFAMCEGVTCPLPGEYDPGWSSLVLGPEGPDRRIPHKEGIGWLQVRFDMPPSKFPGEPAILLPRPADAEEVFLNGSRIGGEGRCGPEIVWVPAGPRLIPFPGKLLRPGENILNVKVLFAERNASAFDAAIFLGERDALSRFAEGLRRQVIIYETSFLTMLFMTTAFYGVLVAKKVVGSQYLLITVFSFLYSLGFFLGSNIGATAGVGGVWASKAQSVIASGLVPVMLSLVTRITGAPLGKVYKAGMAVAGLFVVLDVVFSPAMALIFLPLPRKAFLGAVGAYYLVLAGKALADRREDAVSVLVGVAGYVVGTRLDLFFGLNVRDFGMGVFAMGMTYTLASRHARLKNRIVVLSGRLLDAHEEERRRIARDLHDGVGQSLLALRMRLQRLAVRESADGGIPDPAIDEAARATAAILDDVRRVALDLRPAHLEASNLQDAIRWFGGYFGMERNLQVKVHEPAEPLPEIPPQVKDNVYRIFQEILSNAARHSGATCVDVSIYPSPPGFLLKVSDNGKGFEPGRDAAGGMGLASMRERATLLGGTLRLDTGPGRGTTVTLEVPIP